MSGTVGVTEIPVTLLGPWLRVAALLYPASVCKVGAPGMAMTVELGDERDDDMSEALDELLTELESR